MAYAKIEPFGEERQDLRFAMLMALLANIHRDPKKRRTAYSPEDFMPNFGPPKRKEKSWEEQLKIVEMLNAAMKGKDLRKDKGTPH